MSRDALVVGINVYQKLPALTAPAQDAEAVAQNLESFGEFRVCRLPEVIQSGKPVIGQKGGITTRQLEEALIRLFKPSGKNVSQTALFYYSGHGLQREAGVREGYLATSDANPATGNYGLSLFWLRRLLQASPVRQRIIWLDCCHSGELLNFLEADPGAREGTDRLFMAASREYEPAYEALEGRHSVFTKALLSGLNPYKAKGRIVNGHHLTEAVSSHLKGELQQPLFESSGSEIILTRAAGTSCAVQSGVTTTLDRLKQLGYNFCPYRGLQPFEEIHAGYFFGREQLTAQLAAYVKNAPFCAVVGASGSGKSSLLKAGLIHTLRREQTFSGNGWDIRQITLDQNPLQRLAEAFIDAEEGLERADQLRRAETFLRDGGAGLAQLVRATLNTDSTSSLSSKRLVLVIDQFEQVLPPLEAAGPQEDGDEAARVRSHFIRCLSEVLTDGNLPLHIVIALRADRIERLRPYPAFHALVVEHCLTVLPMAYDQVKAAVVKPLDKVGLEYDANLLYTLMLDVVGAPGELSLLQLTLQELWRRREKDPSGQNPPRITLAAYAELGGVRNLLNRRATDVFNGLSTAEQTVAKRIFLSLCELGDGTEDSRRRACLSELATPSLPDTLISQTLEKLVNAHLVIINQEALPQTSKGGGLNVPNLAWSTPEGLKPESSPPFAKLLSWSPTDLSESAQPVATLDIVHESLIRTWPLLRQWLEDDRQIIWQQRRLEAAAADWQRQGYPTHPEYLLSGSYLREAREFQQQQGHWLSSLAQHYLATSQQEERNHRWRRHAMQLLIPASLLMGMLVSYGQFKVSQHLASTADRPAEPGVELARPATETAQAQTDRQHTARPLIRLIPVGQQIVPTGLLSGVRKASSPKPVSPQPGVLGAGGLIPAQAVGTLTSSGGTTLPPSTPQGAGQTAASQSVIVLWCKPATPVPICSPATAQ